MKIGKKSYVIGGGVVVLLLSIAGTVAYMSNGNIKAEVNQSPTISEQKETRILNPEEASILSGNSQNSDKAYFDSAEVDTSQYSTEQIMDISTEEDYRAAWANGNIVVFNIVADFKVTSTTAAETNVYANSSLANPTGTRQIVIEGNGHTVDFRGLSYQPNSNTWHITMQNLKVYSRNYWGPVSVWRLSASNKSTQTFHNFTNIGAQMLHSPYTDVILSGDIVNRNVSSYISPIDDTSQSTQANNQHNLDVSNLTMLGGATFYGVTTSASNIRVRDGEFVTHKGAEITLDARTTNNVTGENNGAGLVVDGDVTIGKNAVLNYLSDTSRYDYGAIALTARGSTMTLDENSVVNISQNGRTGNSSLTGRSPIFLNSSSVFMMKPNSQMNVNIEGVNTSTVISAGAGSKFTIDNGAALRINTEGSRGNIINISNGTSSNRTQFAVLDGGTFEIAAKNTSISGSAIFSAGNYSEFTVGKKGIFKVSSDGTGSKQLLSIGTNSTFQFKDAEQVDLQFTDTMATSSALINMSNTSGKWMVDVQSVKQWNRGTNISGEPDYHWTPMFGMSIPYSGTAVNRANIVASSVLSSQTESFKANLNTGPTTGGIVGAQRILFEYIPDVVVSIDSVANDLVTDESSNTIYGAVNPDAYVRISYTPPSGGKEIEFNQTVPSPVDVSDIPAYKENFTTKETSDGRYSYTLPDNQRFEAGGIIKVYAFLNGKYDEQTQVVLDKTPPTADPVEYHVGKGDPVPSCTKLVKNAKDSNPVPPGIFCAYTEASHVAIQSLINEVGEHEVDISIWDGSENQAVVTSKIIVHETTNEISAKNFEASATILNGMTEAQLKNYIIQESQAKAQKIVDGVFTDLTEKIQVTNLGGLSASSAGGSYSVELRVLAADSGLSEDLITTVQVSFLDEEPPTGTGKLTFINKGDVEKIKQAEDYSVFLSECADNVTPKEQIKITLVSNQDVETIVGTLGHQSFEVELTDVAGNSSKVNVPIYVYEEPFVCGEDAAVTGEDFSIDYADWNGDLRKIVIENGRALGWQVVNNELKDVTDSETEFHIDFSEVTEVEGTPHPIVISVRKEATIKASKNIFVTFNDKTKPTAESRTTRVRITDADAILKGDLKSFVNELADNVSDVANIRAELSEGQDIVELVATAGEKLLKIDFTDEAGNKATIETKILVYDNGLTVEFVNENGDSIHTSVRIVGYEAGQTVNLNDNQEVLAAIEELIRQNYQIQSRPPNEMQVLIEETATTVQYVFEGRLFIYSAPNVIDFGTANTGFSGVKVALAQYDVPFEVWDNRYHFTNWQLTAQLLTPLQKNGAEGLKTLHEAIRYRNPEISTEDIILTEEPETIVQHKHKESGRYSISESWDSGETGFKLELPAGAVRELGEYQATILWKLGETP